MRNNSRKSTPHAAEGVAALDTQLSDWGLVEVHVIGRGPGSGRESAIRGLAAGGS